MRASLTLTLTLALSLSGCREPENSVNPTDTGYLTSADDTGDRPRDAGAADDSGSGDGPGTPHDSGGGDIDSGGSGSDPCNPAATPTGYWKSDDAGVICYNPLPDGKGDPWGCIAEDMPRNPQDGGAVIGAVQYLPTDGQTAMDCACAAHGLDAANRCDLTAATGLSACPAAQIQIYITYLNDEGDWIEAVCATD